MARYGLAECAWQIDGDQITVTAIVPPNTNATVTLPGSDREPFSVGSGTHRWQYVYSDPHTKAPLSLDSTVGEVIDDATAWTALTRVIAEMAPGLGFIKPGLMGQSGVRLRQALAGLPMGKELAAAIERAFAERSQ